QPDTIDEAIGAWQEAKSDGRRVWYFGGGTELVTGARERAGEFDTLIDLKRIPELSEFDPAARRFGAATRLSRLADECGLPLVAKAAAGVADRTVRNSITLGGNLCSRLPYRETMLPLLLFDATITLVGPSGRRTDTVGSLYAKRLELLPGEFVVSVELPEAATTDGFYQRRTRDPRVDYPLVTLCMARVDGDLRFAVGGAFGYPVRCPEAEAVMSEGPRRNATRRDRELAEAVRVRAQAACDAIPDRLWADMRASAEYRRELLVLALMDGLAHCGGLPHLEDE
ncbi:MAG TPA: FAD binding domain-containing protein, partial [Spirochaetia bacterium]|nr:FAD binding domain-containing protein [Spirochaetia bacterium]